MGATRLEETGRGRVSGVYLVKRPHSPVELFKL
jgi:hypothetical protein